MATLLKCEQVLDSLEMAKPVSMSNTAFTDLGLYI